MQQINFKWFDSINPYYSEFKESIGDYEVSNIISITPVSEVFANSLFTELTSVALEFNNKLLQAEDKESL